jgi:hypothetical protein
MAAKSNAIPYHGKLVGARQPYSAAIGGQLTLIDEHPLFNVAGSMFTHPLCRSTNRVEANAGSGGGASFNSPSMTAAL